MSSPSKTKGNTYEREIVELLQAFGYKAKRAWGSDGRSIGMPADVDVVADTGFSKLKIQCKRRKQVPKWLQLGNADMVTFRADRQENYVILRFEDLLKCLQFIPNAPDV